MVKNKKFLIDFMKTRPRGGELTQMISEKQQNNTIDDDFTLLSP